MVPHLAWYILLTGGAVTLLALENMNCSVTSAVGLVVFSTIEFRLRLASGVKLTVS